MSQGEEVGGASVFVMIGFSRIILKYKERTRIDIRVINEMCFGRAVLGGGEVLSPTLILYQNMRSSNLPRTFHKHPPCSPDVFLTRTNHLFARRGNAELQVLSAKTCPTFC